MFPLARPSLPADADSLRAAIEEGLRGTLRASHELVSVRDERYPVLQEIRVSLDDAIVNDRPPALANSAGAVEPALQVGALEVSGAHIRVQGAAVDLKLAARDVAIGQGRDRSGDVVLVPQSAADGSIEIRLTTSDLEQLVRTNASRIASQQGVTIEEVRIELRARSERALDVTVRVRARKLFLTAGLRIGGSAEVDEQLTAKLRDLSCDGDGTLGTLACGFLGPHLQRFDGREFSLLALSLGEIKLSEVRVSGGSELRLSARFGRG